MSKTVYLNMALGAWTMLLLGRMGWSAKRTWVVFIVYAVVLAVLETALGF